MGLLLRSPFLTLGCEGVSDYLAEAVSVDRVPCHLVGQASLIIVLIKEITD